jgi:gliding motility-associated-like protein
VQNLTSPTIGAVTYADVFFAKYDASGNYVYVKKITGGPGLLYSYLTLDLSGNIYLAAGFSETADFDPGPGTLNLTSKGDYDIFIAKYDNNGNIIYAKNMGGVGYDHALAIAVDATGSIYISGEFSAIADFDPDVAITQNLTAILGDAFLAKYDASGNYVYAKQIGSVGSDYSEHLTLDPSGNVIVAGAFEETVYFDCITSLTALGATDLFLAKYGPILTAITQQPVNVSLCDKGNTSFSIKATDHSSSLWQVNTGSGWINLTNNANYAGTGTDSLIISNVNTTMNNYQFRCMVVNRCDTLFSFASALVVFSLPSAFLPADTSICTNGGSLTINALPGFTKYLWYNSSMNSSITITNPGTYWLQVTDQKNCKNKDSITVGIQQCLKGFYVPSAFTPNRDGKNDLFRPLLFGNVKKYQFIIYNRWGEVVFETTDVSKGWDGNIKGTNQSTNVFVWLCYYEFEGEKTKFEKGTVVLIR